MTLKDFVKLVAETPRSAAELAELSGYPLETVERVLAKLAADGLIRNIPPPTGEPS